MPMSHSLPERLTPHLRRLIAGGSEGIAAQYRRQDEHVPPRFTELDPLGEERAYSVGRGLVRNDFRAG